jgi:hypothetical protein
MSLTLVDKQKEKKVISDISSPSKLSFYTNKKNKKSLFKCILILYKILLKQLIWLIL